jgi:hypothetical protein
MLQGFGPFVFVVNEIVVDAIGFQGEITIQWAKKDVKLWRKIIKIEQIFMFCYLKPWKSW